MVRAAIYVRVSKKQQTVENQELRLREYCKARGYEAVVFKDEETDHDLPESARNGFNDMMRAAHRREFDRVVVWSVDRLTRRGIGAVFSLLEQLRGWGVGWDSLQEPWATDGGPTGQLLLAILAWAAEQERVRISERVRAAHARKVAAAKQHGVKVRWGRPKGSKDKRPRKRKKWENTPPRKAQVTLPEGLVTNNG